MLGQCQQYFDLRCRLLDSLTLKDQKHLQVRTASMLDDEIDWLNNFEPSDTEESSLWITDNLVMAGHLLLAKTLLTCEGMDKKKIGELCYSDIIIIQIIISKIYSSASNIKTSHWALYKIKCKQGQYNIHQ